MKIVRYQDAGGAVHWGQLHADERVTRLSGELFGTLSDSGDSADVQRLLAPLVPVDIICIGLNYRK
ncbi:MAG: DUF2437 domain-containing protein, partial [Planctomycetales bacterium]|nr:DUF2437 domain-containing protein [Planctomycetales bacterium]